MIVSSSKTQTQTLQSQNKLKKPELILQKKQIHPKLQICSIHFFRPNAMSHVDEAQRHPLQLQLHLPTAGDSDSDRAEGQEVPGVGTSPGVLIDT